MKILETSPNKRVSGSVDEKLQTCDFKRKQYLKLVTPLGLRVEYVYVLSDWFKKEEYKDMLDYIQSVNCHYKFNELPLAWLGLAVKKQVSQFLASFTGQLNLLLCSRLKQAPF